MRLFISSYRAGKHDKELLEFAGKIDKVAVITNAKDYKTPQDRRFKIEDNFSWWRSLGLEPREIDLRPYFHKPGAEKALDGFSFVWLAGGNVFLLRRALRYSKVDKYLGDKARRNELLLGGDSAGAIIMGPTLKYSEMDSDEDSSNFVAEGYGKEALWEGLDLVNYVPVPHYTALDYGEEINEYIERLDKNKIPHKEMTDDQAIIIRGFDERFLA
jgi:dipeptidase E